jgi:cytohesin
MKHLLLTTIAAVLVVGCGESQQYPPEAQPAEPVAEASQSKPRGAKAPNISIHKAAGAGDGSKANIEAVKQHLAAGVDVNAKDRRDGDKTPLMHAVYWGHKEIVELLVAKGADINMKDRQIGYTSLHWGIVGGQKDVEGQKEIVELLIANGADLNAKAKRGRTPLDLAIEWKRTEIADLLRKHGGKTGDWVNADKSIRLAAREGNIEAVKQHLADGVDVNAKQKDGFTPLSLAAFNDHKEIVELLIAKGADVNVKDKYDGTPLHTAAANGHKEIAELLIAKGADVNAETKDGFTPLYLPAANGHKEIVELFIAKGADVNAKDNRLRKTPLDLADNEGQKEIADLLRKHGGKTGEELKAEGK